MRIEKDIVNAVESIFMYDISDELSINGRVFFCLNFT